MYSGCSLCRVLILCHCLSLCVFGFPPGVRREHVKELRVFLLVCGLRRVKDPLYLVEAFSGILHENLYEVHMKAGMVFVVSFLPSRQQSVSDQSSVVLMCYIRGPVCSEMLLISYVYYIYL